MYKPKLYGDKHRKANKGFLKQGNLYVQRNTSSIFLAPTIPANHISYDMIETWFDSEKSLATWSKTFRLSANHVKNESIGTLVTRDGLKREEQFAKASKAFQTPKRKQFAEVAPDLKSIKRYKSMLEDKEFNPSNIEDLVRHFDESINNLSNQVHSFQLIQSFLSNLLKDSTSSVDLKLSEITDTIGRKPMLLDNMFAAPDLWGTISEIGSELKEHSDTTASNFTTKWVELERKCQRLMNVASVEASVSNQKEVKPLQIAHEAIIDLLKNIIAPRVIDNITRIDTLEADSLNSNLGLATVTTTTSSQDVQRLDNRMKSLEQEVARNRQADGDAVAFFNLGFRSKKEADAWLVMNAPKGNFGYMVDFHTVMEHVHHQITGIDSLSSLGKLYKLKLSTISESLAMTSFETIDPRFLTASGSHSVINSESSYLSHITSFSQWNEPLEGFKKRWKQELNNFRTSHTETLQNHLIPSSPMYSLALTSLT